MDAMTLPMVPPVVGVARTDPRAPETIATRRSVVVVHVDQPLVRVVDDKRP
jgi:hypothetical protein